MLEEDGVVDLGELVLYWVFVVGLCVVVKGFDYVECVGCYVFEQFVFEFVVEWFLCVLELLDCVFGVEECMCCWLLFMFGDV